MIVHRENVFWRVVNVLLYDVSVFCLIYWQLKLCLELVGFTY